VALKCARKERGPSLFKGGHCWSLRSISAAQKLFVLVVVLAFLVKDVSERHHTVPRFYLNRFADDEGRLEMVPRSGGAPILSSVRNAAAETDFYTIEPTDTPEEDPHPRVIEELLSVLEDRAATAMENLLGDRFPPSDEVRYGLANFIALQAVRTWAWHGDFERISDMAWKSMIRSDLDNNPNSSFKPVADDLDRFVIHAGKNYRLGVMLQQMLHLAPFVFAMTWRLYVHDVSAFLTSDEPIGIWTRPGRTESAGILSADAVYVPLDPMHALGLLRSEVPETIIEGSETRARHINVSVAAGARRWLFQRPGSTPLQDAELPPVREAHYVRADRWIDEKGKTHELSVMYRR
jgi:hypothetical protein